MLLNGLSAGLLFMPVTSIVLGGVEPEHAGAASGLLQTFQQLGGAVGLAVIVCVYAAGSVPGSFLPGAQAAFLTSATMAALAGVAGLVALVNRRRTPDPRRRPTRSTWRLPPPDRETSNSVSKPLPRCYSAAVVGRTLSYCCLGPPESPRLSGKRITSL